MVDCKPMAGFFCSLVNAVLVNAKWNKATGQCKTKLANARWEMESRGLQRNSTCIRFVSSCAQWAVLDLNSFYTEQQFQSCNSWTQVASSCLLAPESGAPPAGCQRIFTSKHPAIFSPAPYHGYCTGLFGKLSHGIIAWCSLSKKACHNFCTKVGIFKKTWQNPS